jgi:hypothetical protein
MQNFTPSSLIAMHSNIILIIKYVYCMGKPVAYCMIAPMPAVPPDTNLNGRRKNTHPKA